MISDFSGCSQILFIGHDIEVLKIDVFLFHEKYIPPTTAPQMQGNDRQGKCILAFPKEVTYMMLTSIILSTQADL